MERQNFLKNYAKACDTSNYHPALQLVAFKDGKIIATNAHLLVACPLELHPISEIKHLEGKYIHKDSFKKLYKYPKIKPTAEGIECYDCNGRKEAMFYYHDSKNIIYPQFEKVIEMAFKKDTCNYIEQAFNISYLNIAKKLLINKDFFITITPKEGFTNIIEPKEDPQGQICLLMGVENKL